MKIEELQFKDKVNVLPEEKPATIFDINVIEGTVKYYIDFLNHYNVANIEIVYPIYLNGQILLDNGFEYVDGRYYLKDIIIESENYLTKIGDKCNDNLFTVNALQHALRQYGHKDLADDFIVKVESLNLCGTQKMPEDN
jgi:hypothetical protein